jgi:hypothetical protein
VYLGKKTPGTPWSQKSQALAEGLLLYEQSINQYGIPRRIAEDPEMDGWFEIDDKIVDFAEAAMEDYRKNHKNVEPGAQLRVINTYEGDEDRPADALPPEPSRGGDDSLDGVNPGLPKERGV